MTTKPFVIPKRLVWEAYQRVKANQGSAGIDAVSIEAFDQDCNSHLYRIWNRLSSGSYFPPPVKAVPIPKKSGGTRILGAHPRQSVPALRPGSLARTSPPGHPVLPLRR
jgi:RNA-directed DNA polymerase